MVIEDEVKQFVPGGVDDSIAFIFLALGPSAGDEQLAAFAQTHPWLADFHDRFSSFILRGDYSQDCFIGDDFNTECVLRFRDLDKVLWGLAASIGGSAGSG